jgi:parvulin-like peptidyl-prolyl isomerase
MRRLFVLTLLPSLVATAAPAEIIERIIAKVNGDIITLTEFQERQIAAAKAARVSPDQIGTFLRENNARLLQEAIDEILLIQKAEDAGLGLRPEYVDEVVESIKEDNNIQSEEDFQAALAQEGLTLDDLRENIRKSMTQRMILQRDIEPKIAVSEEQLQEEYEKRKEADFTKPATVSLQEISIPDDAGGLTLAQEIVQRARANEDFSSLARTHSAAPTAESGGDLGEISQGDMSPDLENVAFSLAVGEVSDPIRIGDGYRIVKVVARTGGSVVPFATAKERLRSAMMASRFQEAYDTYIADVREGADIELRVREVPLRLTGPVPTETLFEGVDPFSMMGPGAGTAPVGPTPPGAAAPGPAASSTRYGTPAAEDDEISTTPQASPQRIVPGSILDDEISTTPQATPERIAPGAAPAGEPVESAPPPE